jgi:membrane dipeptidase
MIVLDAHQDCLHRILDRDDNLGETYGDEQGNIPEWKEGGVNAIWFSVWVNPAKYPGRLAVNRAVALIRAFNHQCALYPKYLQPCSTAEQVRRATASGKIAALLGIEGGAAINNDLDLLPYYRQQGVRYMTLTWRGNLAWAGSSQAHESRAPNREMGLTDFGRQVVHEMNRLGIIVDLSHVSDQTFYDAIAISNKPVIVSHSNCRALAPHPRNVTDDMLRRLAANGGVIGVNFSRDFLKTAEQKQDGGTPDIKTVADEVDHMVKIAGIDHVGMGTDFDGGITPASGLKNAAATPKLWVALRMRGYSDEDIRKIAGENFLRVLKANE